MNRMETPNEIPELVAWLEGLTVGHRLDFRMGETTARGAKRPLTLYLDTTIVSYFTARPSRDPVTAQKQGVTREWWSDQRSEHVCFISELVDKEAARGDLSAARLRLDALARFARLDQNSRSYELAERIFARCRLPEHAREDALHVAIAAHHGVHALITWNCTHIANAHIIPRIRHACEAHGCAAPDIYTPEQLIGVCAYGRPSS